tara:strand:+ start:414 stop:692 length:279 start_codon:yes stop_codon:yes gene_type:complete
MGKIYVQNMTSKSGNSIANQFVIRTKQGVYFQSYDSLIVFINNKRQVFLDTFYWDYSNTTGKYRNQFLGENIQETRRKIKNKEYKLKNLNNG